MQIQKLMIVLILLYLAPVQAQEKNQAEDSNGDRTVAVAASQGARDFQASWGYAPAVRTGDYIHMSGVIAGPPGSEPIGAEAFKESLRRSFADLETTLQSLDASLKDVVRINSYHVFSSPYFTEGKLAHMAAIRDVKREFMGTETPAWTAIGVSELFTDTGLVELELTVYAPQ
ncbi:MAG: Rid family hydrolase [Pseudomonadota bacterium]